MYETETTTSRENGVIEGRHKKKLSSAMVLLLLFFPSLIRCLDNLSLGGFVLACSVHLCFHLSSLFCFALGH